MWCDCRHATQRAALCEQHTNQVGQRSCPCLGENWESGDDFIAKLVYICHLLLPDCPTGICFCHFLQCDTPKSDHWSAASIRRREVTLAGRRRLGNGQRQSVSQSVSTSQKMHLIDDWCIWSTSEGIWQIICIQDSPLGPGRSTISFFCRPKHLIRLMAGRGPRMTDFGTSA